MTTPTDRQLKRMVEQLEKPVQPQSQQRLQEQAQKDRLPALDKIDEPFSKHKYSGW